MQTTKCLTTNLVLQLYNGATIMYNLELDTLPFPVCPAQSLSIYSFTMRMIIWETLPARIKAAVKFI